MGITNTWRFSSSTPVSHFKDVSAFESHLSFLSKYQRAKSESAIKLDDLDHRKDRQGDMSLKSLGLFNSHHSEPGDRKASHNLDIPTELFCKELERALRRVLQLGDKVYGRRLEVKEKRNGLYHENKLLAEIDSRFIQNVRQFQEHSKEKFDESIYDQLDAQRDVIGSLQYDYDRAEDAYDVHENHFEQEEKKLLSLLSRTLRLVSNGEDGEESTSVSSSNSHPFHIEPEPPGSTNAKKARLMEYESRLGDARIVHEQLQDLRYEQARRLSISKRREKFGLGRNASDTSENLELRYAEAAKQLSIINDDVQRLQEAVQLDGYSIPDLPANEEPESVLAPPQLHSHSLPTERRKARSASEGKMPFLVQKFAALQHRINRWMFITFEDSPVEHVRHKVILRDICSLDDEKWAHVVPEYWTDEAVTPDDGVHPPMLLSGKSKAAKVVKTFETFERDFPGNGAPKDRSTPYDDTLEFDLLSEYESRSY